MKNFDIIERFIENIPDTIPPEEIIVWVTAEEYEKIEHVLKNGKFNGYMVKTDDRIPPDKLYAIPKSMYHN